MKRLFVLFTLFFIAKSASFAQTTFHKTFARLSDNYAYYIEQTFDGGYILSGATKTSAPSNNDAWIIKLDANGDTMWTHILANNVVGHDMYATIRQLPDSGYIAAGYGAEDHYVPSLSRLDAAGNILWTKMYQTVVCPAPPCKWEIPMHITPTSDGGFAVTGRTEYYSSSTRNLFVFKTDSTGNTEWAKSYSGGGQAEGSSIIQAPDSGFFVLGFGSSSVASSAGGIDMYLIRTNSHGDTLWSKNYGGTASDVGMSISATKDSCYILAGYSGSFGNGDGDAYLVKINAQGDTLWTRVYGGLTSGYTARQCADGGYIISGRTLITDTINERVLLIKTDSVGHIQWSKEYGTSEYDYRNVVCPTSDGGYALASRFKLGQAAYAYVIKTDGNGLSGCNDIDAGIIEANTTTQVHSVPTQYYDVAFTPILVAPYIYTDSITIQNCLIQGYSELTEETGIKIFPNPAINHFSIQSPLKNCQVEIFNVLGGKIYSEKLTSESIYLNQPPGIYLVRVSAGVKVFSQKVVIE